MLLNCDGTYVELFNARGDLSALQGVEQFVVIAVGDVSARSATLLRMVEAISGEGTTPEAVGMHITLCTLTYYICSIDCSELLRLILYTNVSTLAKIFGHSRSVIFSQPRSQA